jgi:hypothetical protein
MGNKFDKLTDAELQKIYDDNEKLADELEYKYFVGDGEQGFDKMIDQKGMLRTLVKYIKKNNRNVNYNGKLLEPYE